MTATDKQIAYLQSLADRVERAKQEGRQDIPTPYIDWKKERNKGVTTVDASIRITAYRTLLCAINAQRVLLGFNQI